jgi:hypothetical protein
VGQGRQALLSGLPSSSCPCSPIVKDCRQRWQVEGGKWLPTFFKGAFGLLAVTHKQSTRSKTASWDPHNRYDDRGIGKSRVPVGRVVKPWCRRSSLPCRFQAYIDFNTLHRARRFSFHLVVFDHDEFSRLGIALLTWPILLPLRILSINSSGTGSGLKLRIHLLFLTNCKNHQSAS